jgi:hypothetical protein
MFTIVNLSVRTTLKGIPGCRGHQGQSVEPTLITLGGLLTEKKNAGQTPGLQKNKFALEVILDSLEGGYSNEHHMGVVLVKSMY